ncbi:MAG TPA: acyl-CoA thioesterase II [Acidimicrobiales bacterium]|nr:acyl-CoA thioesterase II [Acidimicrobiales bacterium]
MTAALDELVELLDLETLDVDLYRGVSPNEERIRVFGGQVAAQSLIAAGRTVADGRGVERPVHSLHAYFLRPGDPKIPILYQVDRIRDGRSFTTRRVAGMQRGEAIFHLSASFHVPEQGVAHQEPMPQVPDPETLPTMAEAMAPYGEEAAEWLRRPQPIDVRPVGEPLRTTPVGSVPRPPTHRMWLRADGRLPDDPLLHACLVAYASDMTLLDTVMLPHGLIWSGRGTQASLDHAMWFHRPFRADEWLLYDQFSPTASGARGLAMGTIFTRDGRLAVSVVQEGLLRAPGGVAVSGR